jgi:hypothetical protein
MQKAKQLTDTYRFSAFRPLRQVHGIFGDPLAWLITLRRRGKKQSAQPVGQSTGRTTINDRAGSVIFPVATDGSIWNWKPVESPVGTVVE